MPGAVAYRSLSLHTGACLIMPRTSLLKPHNAQLRRQPPHFISAVMLLVLAGVVVASSLIARNAIQDQERLILHERAAEVAAVLGSAFSGAQSSLQLLGVIARSDRGHSRLFADAARSVATSSTQAWLVTSQWGAGLMGTPAAGPAPALR